MNSLDNDLTWRFNCSNDNVPKLGIETLTSLSVTGNAIAGNVYANSGTVGASLLTGTLTTAAQPNITSVGSLTSLSVVGTATVNDITSNNANLGNAVTANFFVGSGYNLSNIPNSDGSYTKYTIGNFVNCLQQTVILDKYDIDENGNPLNNDGTKNEVTDQNNNVVPLDNPTDLWVLVNTIKNKKKK